MARPRALLGSPQVPKPLPSSYAWLLSPSPPATAPQQEADTEVNTETLNKSSSQGTSSSTQAAPPETTASTSKDKEASAEKSKDGGSVSIRTSLARDTDPLGQAESQDLSPCLPPLKVA